MASSSLPTAQLETLSRNHVHDQAEEPRSMDSDLYWEAAKGEIGPAMAKNMSNRLSSSLSTAQLETLSRNHVHDQAEEPRSMDSDLYWEAAKGEIGPAMAKNMSNRLSSSLPTAQLETLSRNHVHDQAEEPRSMDSDLYWEAAKGEIGPAMAKNMSNRLLHILTPKENTVLHICIRSATSSADKTNKKNENFDGPCEFVKRVLEKCPRLLTTWNLEKETPLHLAARYGHKRIVEQLVDCARNELDIESGKERVKEMLIMTTKAEDTALHEAVRFNHVDVVEILTKEDPDHFSYAANKSGYIPLYEAVERGYGKVVLQILHNCKPADFQHPYGRNVLHAAAIVGDEGKVLVGIFHEFTEKADDKGKILDELRELTEKSDDRGWTPLHYAASRQCSVTVKNLLEYGKSAAYIPDREGKIPLHIAASKGHDKVMKEIILQCPDCCELVDDRHRNVLHFAVESNQYEAVQVIIKDYSLSNLLNGADDDGNTPLHLIAGASYPSNKLILEAFIELGRVDKLALNNEDQNALKILLRNKSISDSAQEQDLFYDYEWHCLQDSVIFKRLIEKERVFAFLVGLKNELGREVLPSTREVFSQVGREESRRNVMLGKETQETIITKTESSTLATRSNRFFTASNRGNDTRNKKGNRPWCDHCKNPGHTRENCWKLHRKPFHLKNGMSDQVTSRALQTASKESTIESAPISLNKEQLESLMKLLNSTSLPSTSITQ